MENQTALPFDSERDDPAKPSLQAPPDPIARLKAIGGGYIPDFISGDDEKELLGKIGQEKWLMDLKRRVQHYGYRYDYTARSIDAKDKLGDLPAWANAVIEKLTKAPEPVFQQTPDQIIVNEYEPEQGIAPHTDRNCFGPVLASLSLGGECTMKLKNPADKSQDFTVCLKPRSLIFFRGESREKWQHGLRLSKKAERRVSLTFRTVRTQAH